MLPPHGGWATETTASGRSPERRTVSESGVFAESGPTTTASMFLLCDLPCHTITYIKQYAVIIIMVICLGYIVKERQNVH